MLRTSWRKLSKTILVFMFCFLNSKGSELNLKRAKRYISFPEGSSVSATICLTIGVIGNPNINYLSWAENWGVAYNLPTYKWAREHATGFKNETKSEIQRRSRRALYNHLEMAMTHFGLNGMACIRRALCESVRFLGSMQIHKGDMMVEIIKTIFSFPSDYPISREHPDIHQYDKVYRRARRQTRYDCNEERKHCQISLIGLAFGIYPNSSSSVTNQIKL